MLVGEAPGKQEVQHGIPFVGPAGKVLDRLLDRLAIPRSELWISNVVKIRPLAVGTRHEVNRPPTAAEVATYRSFVEREIEIIHPKVIVCLGSVAASALIHRDFKIRDERGCWFTGADGIRRLATYHPSYLLRLTGPDYETARDAMLADLSRAWGEAVEDKTTDS
jgi:DNA polymerase